MPQHSYPWLHKLFLSVPSFPLFSTSCPFLVLCYVKAAFPSKSISQGTALQPFAQISPNYNPILGSHPCTATSHVAPGCLIECYRNDGTPLPRSAYKDTVASALIIFSLLLSCISHSGGSHVIRNLAVRSTNKELKLPANVYMSELRNRHPPPDPGDLQMTETLADPQLSCSWISDPQKSWDNKCLLFSN